MNIFKAFVFSLVLIFVGCSNSDSPKQSGTPTAEELSVQKEWDEMPSSMRELICTAYKDITKSGLPASSYSEVLNGTDSKATKEAKEALLKKEC